jgi:hypothetical protein
MPLQVVDTLNGKAHYGGAHAYIQKVRAIFSHKYCAKVTNSV